MFHLTTCPTCKTKFTLPEAAMGKRQVCPHCQSPFLAGKSTAEPETPVKAEGGAAPVLAKTMLGETEPMIKYNCPRCKKALEAAASEAGTKKPCPECGQRLQVPAAPVSAAPPAPALNKTMLAETQPPIKYNCPNCKKPLESPAIEGGTKKACPECGQRLQIPMAVVLDEKKPALNKTMLASDASKAVAPGAPQLSTQAAQTTAGSAPPGATVAPPQGKSMKPFMIAGAAVGGVLLLGLFSCVVVTAFTGPSKADREKYELAMKEIEKAKKEVEDLKKSIQDQEAEKIRHGKELADSHNRWKEYQDKVEKDKRDYDQQQKDLRREREIELLRYQNDQAARAKAEAIFEQKERELEASRKAAAEALRIRAEEQKAFEARMAAAEEKTRQAIAAANRRREERTVIINQPPPVYPHYPPWHPYRPFGW